MEYSKNCYKTYRKLLKNIQGNAEKILYLQEFQKYKTLGRAQVEHR
jgi:hypothetical protein